MSAASPRSLLRLALRSCLLLPMCWPALSSAQTTADADPVTLSAVTITEESEKPYTVDASAAATKLPLTLRDTPQSVTVITRQRMDDENLQSMRDVLDNTTGVYSYAFDTERVVFTARGFIIDNTLYDGVPVAPGLNASSIDATLDTALYERIEVVRGATGLLTGAGSPSAAVNLVRKHAQSDVLTGSLSLSYGSWDDFRSVADISTPLSSDGKIRARVVGVYQNRESYIDLYSNEKQVFYGVIDADLSADTRVSAGYDYQQTLPQANTWGSFPLFFSDGTPTDWPRSFTTAAQWSYWNNRTQTAFAELQHRFSNGWSLRSTVQRRETDGYSNLFYVYGFPDKQIGDGLEPYAYHSIDHGRQNSVDTYLTGPFELFGRKHELVVGGMGSWLHGDSYEFQPPEELPDPGSFYGWDGSYPEPDFADVGDYISRIRTQQSAAYSALRLSLTDPLKLVVGARYSRWKGSSYYVYDGPEAFKQNHKKLTPYAGLIFDFTQQWSAFASYTKIFNPQNFQEADGAVIAPLNGHSSEVGIKGAHFDGRLNTSLTLFDTRQDNVAVADPGQFVNDDPERPAYVEADGTRTRGFELDVSGEPLKNWNVSLGGSYYKIEDGDGARIKTYIPQSLIRVFTTYSLQGSLQNLTIGGGIDWQSRNYLDVENPVSESGLSEVDQSAVSLVGLMARYQVTPTLSLQANGNNLLDKKYYVIDEYGNLYYGPPVNASLTLRYDF